MMKRILLAAVAVVVGVPLLMTAWFYIGGIETGDTSLPDDADLRWTPPEVADEDNAFVAIIATTNLVNTSNFETNKRGWIGLPELQSDEPGAAEKVDRIIADNEAFYAAFAKGLERNGFRNTLPPLSKEILVSMLPLSEFLRMAKLWQLKIRREIERGEWDAAVADLEVLHRFGRVVSDNAATVVDLMIGNSIEGMARGKIQYLVSCGGLSASQLARIAELVDADAKAEPENVTRIVKAEYSLARAHLDLMSPEYVMSLVELSFSTTGKIRQICKTICAEDFGVSVSDDSSSDRMAKCLIRTIVCWPGHFRYTLHRKTTQKRLADIARKALNGEIDDAANEDGSHGFFSRNGFGRATVRNFAYTCQLALAGKDRMGPMFARARTQLVIAAARWRLAHDGEMPPTLGALVPQYLPAVWIFN